MNELSALAGSERYRACADEGLGRVPNKRFCFAKTASVSTLALLAGMRRANNMTFLCTLRF